MKDKDIVLDQENPEWTAEMMSKAVLKVGGVVVRPAKEQVSIRIDPDVLLWFRSRGKGYQKEINALLRTYMETHQESQKTTRPKAKSVGR
jgi:uncharacterized protein (DUF4415 family)